MSEETSYAELLREGLEEAIAIKEGRRAPARVSRHEITARTTTVAPPPRYQADDIRRIRRALGLSQTVFAQMLAVSASTVRAWERSARVPDGPTLRLLEVADREPDALLSALTPAA